MRSNKQDEAEPAEILGCDIKEDLVDMQSVNRDQLFNLTSVSAYNQNEVAHDDSECTLQASDILRDSHRFDLKTRITSISKNELIRKDTIQPQTARNMARRLRKDRSNDKLFIQDILKYTAETRVTTPMGERYQTAPKSSRKIEVFNGDMSDDPNISDSSSNKPKNKNNLSEIGSEKSPTKFETSAFSNYCCSVCKTRFNNSLTEKLPLLLVNCGHTICTQCLLNQLLDQEFSENEEEPTKAVCPICQTPTPLPQHIQKEQLTATLISNLVPTNKQLLPEAKQPKDQKSGTISSSRDSSGEIQEKSNQDSQESSFKNCSMMDTINRNVVSNRNQPQPFCQEEQNRQAHQNLLNFTLQESDPSRSGQKHLKGGAQMVVDITLDDSLGSKVNQTAQSMEAISYFDQSEVMSINMPQQQQYRQAMTLQKPENVWMCEVHVDQQKPIEAFCDDCDTPLCMQCILTMNHKGHEMIDLKDAADKCKEKFLKIVDKKVMPSQGTIAQNILQLQQQQQNVKQTHQTNEEKIKSIFSQLRSQLDLLEATTLTALNQNFDRTQTKSNLLECQLVDLSKQIMQILEQQDELKSFTKVNPEEILRPVKDRNNMIDSFLRSLKSMKLVSDEYQASCDIFNKQRQNGLINYSEMTKFINKFYSYTKQIKQPSKHSPTRESLSSRRNSGSSIQLKGVGNLDVEVKKRSIYQNQLKLQSPLAVTRMIGQRTQTNTKKVGPHLLESAPILGQNKDESSCVSKKTTDFTIDHSIQTSVFICEPKLNEKNRARESPSRNQQSNTFQNAIKQQSLFTFSKPMFQNKEKQMSPGKQNLKKSKKLTRVMTASGIENKKRVFSLTKKQKPIEIEADEDLRNQPYIPMKTQVISPYLQDTQTTSRCSERIEVKVKMQKTQPKKRQTMKPTISPSMGMTSMNTSNALSKTTKSSQRQLQGVKRQGWNTQANETSLFKDESLAISGSEGASHQKF